MITRIEGSLKERRAESIVLDVHGIGYEVYLPGAVLKTFDDPAVQSAPVALVTYHYFQLDPSKGVPVLIGFLKEGEKAFFELFITVSGIGPRAACRALSLPFGEIADAIDRSDIAFLKTLPGIGEQRARQIVAKLQGKVGAFRLGRGVKHHPAAAIPNDVKAEALKVLLQLQYREKEAEAMIEKALSRDPSLTTCEAILNEVYRSASAGRTKKA